MGAPVLDTDDGPEPDWVDELALAVERVMVVAETLREDRQLMQAARRLLEDMDGIGLCLDRKLFEAVAGCLLVAALEEQRKARPGRGPKSER